MKIMEFGRDQEAVVLLLHGGGLSWWNYRDAAELMARRYHVVLPVLDGHAGSDTPFTTIEDNAERILQYIDEQFSGQITALGGVSLGGQIALEVLSQRPGVCKAALIESAMTHPMKLTGACIGPALAMSYGLIRQKWFAKLQFSYLRIGRDLFDEYYRDTCKISKEDMTAFMKANCGYTLKPGLSQVNARVRIVAGSQEPHAVRKSAKQLHRAIPGSTLENLPGMYHGELSINHPDRYARMLDELCREEGRKQ